MRQCRCPGPKTEHVVTPCKHHPKPDITQLLREELRKSLLDAGHSPEGAEHIIADLEAFTEKEVKRIKEGRK